MATTFQFPVNNFGPGSQTFPARNVPAGTSRVTISVDRSTMTDPALDIQLTIDFSPDGGVTWASVSPSAGTDPFPCSAEIVGGVLHNKDGSVATVSSVSCDFPPATAPMVRATVVVSGAPLTTIVTIALT